MSLKVGVLMHPLSLSRASSSTADLVGTGVQRGHRLWIFHPSDLSVESGGRVGIVGRPVESAHPDFTGYGDCGAAHRMAASEFDIILFRLQPPLEFAYFAVCHILARVETSVLIVNRPSALARVAEKLFAMDYPDLHPATVVSSEKTTLAEFRRSVGDVIVKPLYDFQGAGVFFLRSDDKNFDALFETLTRLYRAPVVMQEYLTEAMYGDKRIFLIHGAPVAALNRVPAEGSARANLHAGGRPEPTQLSERDLEICARLGPRLARDGFLFVGLDVIGDYVTEISVTSPTGIVQVRDLGGPDVSTKLWEQLERITGASNVLSAARGAG